MDITVAGNFSFINNFDVSPWDYGMQGRYYDRTEIIGRGVIPQLGEIVMHFAEYADTAVLNDHIIWNNVRISQGPENSLYIDATPSINFKKLMREAGGAFSGDFTVTRGSAEHCVTNVFTNLPPLTVTGNLDVGNHIVTFGIKGKVYF